MPIWIRCLGACLEVAVGLLLLVALVPVTFQHGYDSRTGRHRAAQSQARQLATVIERFRNDCGRLPDQLDELFGVVRGRSCFTTPPRPSQLVDPWGSRLVYWRADDGSAFEMRSLGPDRTYGSSDDLTSGGWTWPWPQPPWDREERVRRIGRIAMLVLTLLLALAVFWRITGFAVRAIHWLCLRSRSP